MARLSELRTLCSRWLEGECPFLTRYRLTFGASLLGGPLFLGGLIAALVGLAQPTLAAHLHLTQCHARDLLLQRLSDRFGEATVALGVTGTGSVVEVLTAPHGETWTITVTSPQGITCLLAAGEGWKSKARTITGPDT